MTKEPTFHFRTIILFSLLTITLLLAISVYGWVKIPAGQQIPVHWGIDGTPDRYGGKAEGLLMMPGLAIFLTALFAFLPRIDPRRKNLIRSQKAYITIWAGALVLLLLIHLLVVLSVMGWAANVGKIVPAAVGILFIVIGNYLPKTQSNFYVGIRTPWTLSSNLSWYKTHRLAGRLFILLGLILFGGLFFQSQLWVWVLIVSLVAMLVVLAVYSYLVWKDDPEKQKFE